MPAPTTTTLSLVPNFNTIGVYLNYTAAGGWAANTLAVTVEVLSGSTWVPCHYAVPDPTGLTVFRTKILGLAENTTYTVRCRFRRIPNAGGADLEDFHTVGAATTRTLPPTPPVSESTCVFVAPTGLDANSGLTSASPKLTIGSAITAADAAGRHVVVVEDGDYTAALWNFEAGGAGTVWAGGTSNQYKCIRARNAGMARIYGGRLLNGAWTRVSANVYWHTLTGFTNTGDATLGPAFLRNETGGSGSVAGNVLPIYHDVAALTAGTAHGAGGEGFCIDWANGRIYVRTVTDVSPGPTQYSATHASGIALYLYNSAFVILDGLKVEMFGAVDRVGATADQSVFSPTFRYQGLIVGRSQDVVVRRFTFVVADLFLDPAWPDGARVTIEDNYLEDHDPWGKQLTPAGVYDNALFNLWDGLSAPNRSINDRHMVDVAGCRQQCVVRRNTLRKGWIGILAQNPLTGSPNDQIDQTDCDFHDNVYERIFEDANEYDWAVGGGVYGQAINFAAWNNRLTNVGGAFSVAPGQQGPVFVVNNKVENWGLWWMRRGDNVVANATSHCLCYNNTVLTTLLLDDSPYAGVEDSGFSGGGQTNFRSANNVSVHTSNEHMQRFDSVTANPGTGNPDVEIKKFVVYSTEPTGDPEWYWAPGTTAYQTWEAMDAAIPDGQLLMTDCVDCNALGLGSPLPSGIDGPVLATLPASTAVDGVTNFAADASGNRLTTVPLGAFPQLLLAAAAAPVVPDPSPSPPMTHEETLVAIRDALAAQYLAIVQAGPKPDYTIDGQRVEWTDYLEFLSKQLADANEAIGIAAGPYEFHSQGFVG